MFNLYQYHSKQYVEDLRKTLKGKVEHRIFALFLTARNTEDMDKYFYRLLDVRFERKKCEAKAASERYYNNPEVIARRDAIRETVKRIRREYEVEQALTRKLGF